MTIITDTSFAADPVAARAAARLRAAPARRLGRLSAGVELGEDRIAASIGMPPL